MNEISLETLQQQAADFKISSLIGRPWSEINDIINKHKDNGFFLKKINQSTQFQDYCHEQAEQFLNRRVALTEKDFKAIKILWLYGNLELDDILLIKDRIEDNDYIRTDRFRDFDKDKNMRLFAEKISDIKEELDVPDHLGPSIRTEQRQHLVDYIRFMESGQKNREMIKKGNWEALSKEFEHFPRMKSEFIIDLYKKEEEKNPDSERLQMMARIFIYRLNDIDDGKWTLKSKNELDAIEDFIKESYKTSEASDFISRILTKISEAREALGNKTKKTQKEAQTLIVDEGTSQEDVVRQIIPEKENPPYEKADENPKRLSEIKPSENIKGKESVEKETSPAKDDQNNWQQKALKDWNDWAKNNNKQIKSYEPKNAPQDLAFKIYSDKGNTNNLEADIHYKEQNHMVVKGKPSNEVFDGIVAIAKKNGNPIIFGDIKSDDFKARLLLACLKDGNIEVINAPKIDDLQNISQSLKEALRNPTKNKIDELKEKCQKLDQQHHESGTDDNPRPKEGKRRNGNQPNHNGGSKRRRRKFTEEEKKAFLERKKQEAMLDR